jgi:hypothetical protein
LPLYKKTGEKKDIMKISGVFVVFICLIGVLYFVSNYQSSSITTKYLDDAGSFPVQVIVTQNYGEEIILDEDANVEPGENVLDGLKQVADVTFNYGGGFVESINGIKSTFAGGLGDENDWFFYVNGMLPHNGATDIFLYPGDIERWDFHNWGSDRITTAIISDYPEPFLHGINGISQDTTIVYSDEFYYTSVALRKSLKQHHVTSNIKSFEELSDDEKTNHNLILIDTYENNLISELNNNAKNLGFFIEIKNNHIKTFDAAGDEDQIFDHGGIILATQNPWNLHGSWNGENVAWIITGLSVDDVTNAAKVLINNNHEIKNTASIVIFNEKIYKVP